MARPLLLLGLAMPGVLTWALLVPGFFEGWIGPLLFADWEGLDPAIRDERWALAVISVALASLLAAVVATRLRGPGWAKFFCLLVNGFSGGAGLTFLFFVLVS